MAACYRKADHGTKETQSIQLKVEEQGPKNAEGKSGVLKISLIAARVCRKGF
jgi:hypothetical protein